jgi:MFS transporter, DHA3 family, macrolide efflux protein
MKRQLWNKNFLLLMQGNLVSRVGDVIYLIAVNYWIYEKTNSTAAVGIYTSIVMLPSIFLSVFIGAMVDVLNRKKVIVFMDIARGLIMLLVAILAYTNHLSLPLLYILGFLAAVCAMFFEPAVISVIPTLVETEDLIQAQALTSSARTGIDILGKAVSGYLLSIFGFLGSVVINAISYFLSACSEQFINIPKFKREHETLSFTQILSDMKVAGLYFFKDRPLLMFLLSGLLANLFTGGFLSMMWPFAKSLNLTISQFGVWMSVLAIIDLCAMIGLGAFKIPLQQRSNVFKWSCIGCGISYIVALSSNNFLLITVLLGFGTFFNVILNMLVMNAFMLMIPQSRKGAIFGVIITLTQLGSMLSVLIYGLLGVYFPIRIIALIGNTVGILPMLWLALNKGISQHFTQDVLCD